MTLNEGYSGRIFNVQGMYNFVEGVVIGREMHESTKALLYMRKAHKELTRQDGQPYMVHPLGMVCYLLSLRSEFVTDVTIATALLHDVPEETGTSWENLPFTDAVLRGVKYMTITKFPDETDYEKKRRYAWELLECFDSAVVKGADMYNNFRTMPTAFDDNKIRKNIVEADMLRLPVLKEAENTPDWADAKPLFQVLRTNIQSLVDPYAKIYKVKLTDPDYVNAPDAEDYSYLITGKQSS